jgi:hypothetical protein
MKMKSFSKLWEYDIYCKIKSMHSKKKNLEGFTWIKSGVVVKEVFRIWKTLSTSTTQEKGWSFRVKQVKGATIKEYWKMKHW